jgi:hypothetical protein
MLDATFHLHRSGAATAVVATAATTVIAAAAITITMAGDDITPAQPATAAQSRRSPSVKGGFGRGVSGSNEELTALIVQGYIISSDSAVAQARPLRSTPSE